MTTTSPGTALAALGVALLVTSCTSHTPALTDAGALPVVPRAVRPERPACLNATSFESARFFRDREVVQTGALQGQSASAANVYNLLLTTRVALNGLYHGPSSADFQALHQQHEVIFREKHPGDLTRYPLGPTTDALMSAYLKGVEDAHTYYLDVQGMRSVRGALDGSQQERPSFGLTFGVPGSGDGAVVRHVIHDAPAYQVGLRRGDVIVELNGQRFTPGADAGETAAKYTRLFREAADTAEAVHLKYRRVADTRSTSIQARVLQYGQFPWGEVRTSSDGKQVYHLYLKSFSRPMTGQRVHDLIAQAQAQGARNLLLDLRDNGGGLVMEEIAAAGAFTPEHAGMTIERISANDLTFRYVDGRVRITDRCGYSQSEALNGPQLWKGRTVVLVNERTASGGEMLAQQLAKAGAPIIGEDTYGVADTSVNILPLPGERGVAVTTARVRGMDGQYHTSVTRPGEAQRDDMNALARGEDLAVNAAMKHFE